MIFFGKAKSCKLQFLYLSQGEPQNICHIIFLQVITVKGNIRFRCQYLLNKTSSNGEAQFAFKRLCSSHLALHQWLTHFDSNPVALHAAVRCECSLLYKVHQPPFTQLSGFSFKMRTRLTVCDGTGGPQGHEGGQQGLEQGGAEEMGQTETEERRQTGQPYKARKSKVLNETERN